MGQNYTTPALLPNLTMPATVTMAVTIEQKKFLDQEGLEYVESGPNQMMVNMVDIVFECDASAAIRLFIAGFKLGRAVS